MQRLPEPELMDDSEQVTAYANADFAAAHGAILAHFPRLFPHTEELYTALDLGCGTADIAIRFARMHPNCKIDAVDGAANMLVQAQTFIERESLQDRIVLYHQCLPNCELPNKNYDAIVSNSLLHHLHEPQHLWLTLKRYATAKTAILICDLFRPASQQAATLLVEQYASGEPEILCRDFFNSLLAAFTFDEVNAQLSTANLYGLQIEQISDRHMLIHGHLQ